MHTTGGLVSTFSKEQHNFNMIYTFQIYLSINIVIIVSKNNNKHLYTTLHLLMDKSTF